jgi:hypothetical protein
MKNVWKTLVFATLCGAAWLGAYSYTSAIDLHESCCWIGNCNLYDGWTSDGHWCTGSNNKNIKACVGQPTYTCVTGANTNCTGTDENGANCVTGVYLCTGIGNCPMP